MKARTLLEDPNSIRGPWSSVGIWSRADARPFGYVSDIYVCATHPTTHGNLLAALKFAFYGEEYLTYDKDEDGDVAVQIEVWKGNEKVDLARLKEVSEINPDRLYKARGLFSTCGRFWLNEKIISFWHKWNDVPQDRITDPIVKAGGNPKEWEYQFLDTDRDCIPYSSLADWGKPPSELTPLSKEREKELMAIQHLDPNAKKVLYRPNDLFAKKRTGGFATPAQRNYVMTVGDSLAQAVVDQLLS